LTKSFFKSNCIMLQFFTGKQGRTKFFTSSKRSREERSSSLFLKETGEN
jgi:hypothetical protein